METMVGLNWINRIAVITLIFGTAFFFKYAIDNNWIGPGVRVALGVLAAAVSMVCGDRMWRRGQQIFAQGLLGLGLALLYLSFYAAFQLYQLFPQGVSFVLMMAVTGLAFVLSVRYESRATALLGLLGGYLTPVMLSTGQNHPWVLFGYTFVLNSLGLLLARTRRWPVLEFVTFAATLLLFGGWFATWFDDANRAVATVFAVAFYGQLASAQSPVVWLLTQLFASFGAPELWTQPQNFLWLEMVFAAGGLIVADRRRWKGAPAWSLFTLWLPYWLWVVFQGQPQDRGMIFGALLAAFILFFGWTLWWSKWRGRLAQATDLLVLAANATTFYAASYRMLNPVAHAYMGTFTLALGAIHLILAKILWKEATDDDEGTWPGLLALAITLTFLTLAIPIQLTGFRVTMAWALEGVAIAWVAARFKNDLMRLAALIVFLLALARLVAWDAWIYPDGNHFTAVLNSRFLTFTVMTACLWLAARMAGAAVEAMVLYVAGHFVLLWILILEIAGWAERSVRQADLPNVETAAISILMALYALTLVSAGVVTRTPINRFLGLGLMGIVVAKLYLYDVWQLSRGFRITAFLGLGAMLLVVSYLYSRFKPIIERLWKDDGTS
jgi:uncharacterized membrane protein